MTQTTRRPSPLAVAGLYFFSALLVAWPLTDLLTTAWPTDFASLEYRYGFMGLLAGFLHTPTLGLVLAMVLAYLSEHWKTLRALSALCLLGSLLLLLVVILFPLDVLQMRSITAPETHGMMKTGAIIAELKHLTGMTALALLGFGGWRSPVPAGTAAGKRRKGGSDTGTRTGDLAMKPSRYQEETTEQP